MKKTRIAFMAASVITWSMTTVFAQEGQEGKEDPSAKPATLLMKYKPPMLGRPTCRIGGGTRGASYKGLSLIALAPEHAALTAKPQPSLCWYLSTATELNIELTINDKKKVSPLLEQSLGKVEKPGISCVNLSAFNITLQPDTEYQWFVAVVTNPDERSKDIVSGGGIKFVAPDRQLADKLGSLQGGALAEDCAENSYWYDAVETMVNLEKKEPANQMYKAMREDLLQQGCLPRLGD